MGFHQPASPPPLSIPLFLEQDEGRMQETVGVGSQYVSLHVHTSGRGSRELQKGIEEMMEENRRLKEKIERLEKAQSSQSEEDPKCSTPNRDHLKEAETRRRLIDHQREVSCIPTT